VLLDSAGVSAATGYRPSSGSAAGPNGDLGSAHTGAGRPIIIKFGNAR